jgi:hypothetical protein
VPACGFADRSRAALETRPSGTTAGPRGARCPGIERSGPFRSHEAWGRSRAGPRPARAVVERRKASGREADKYADCVHLSAMDRIRAAAVAATLWRRSGYSIWCAVRRSASPYLLGRPCFLPCNKPRAQKPRRETGIAFSSAPPRVRGEVGLRAQAKQSG